MTRERDVRHEARESALQMLYEWELRGGELDEIIATSWAVQARSLDVERDALAGALVRGTVQHLDRLDPLIAEACEHWRLDRLATIDRLVLRLAVFELLERPRTPAVVVIDEAVELARTFGTDDSSRFVNGVLDAIKRRVRPASAGARHGEAAGREPSDERLHE